MALFVIPPIFYAMINWPSEYGITQKKKSEMISAAQSSYIRISAVIMIVYTTLYFTGKAPEGWGNDRAIAFAIGQCVFGAVIFTPMRFIRVGKASKRR